MRIENTRALMKDAALTCASLVIVTLAVLYIISPPVVSMALDVSAQSIPGDIAVVYGTVTDSASKPVKGATVTVSSEQGGTVTRVLTTSVAADGTFRGEIPSANGTYRVAVAADTGARVARNSITLSISSGHAFCVAARLVERDYFTFLPVSSY